ncbi:MAG: BREX-1 system adenine-specific DNA-methyltransferase PglX [Candidatus Thermoplasmatota archaeon]|nr:BREX-1 system adenine-specific DNA-methyltransferase PglX [Candidatus Thermoplasmatota archaeon]
MLKKEINKNVLQQSSFLKFRILIETIYRNVASQFREFDAFQNLVMNQKSIYHSSDVVTGQKPESLVKQFIVEPIMSFLGLKWTDETGLKTSSGNRVPDYSVYTIDFAKPLLYIEAEPMNTDLYEDVRSGHKVGLGQVKEWLFSRFSKTDHAIATDGFLWILVSLESENASLRQVLSMDLRPFFRFLLTSDHLPSTPEFDETISDFFNLQAERISNFLEETALSMEEEKDEVSNRFYQKYMEYVLGRDHKGNLTERRCLLNSIIPPENVKENQKELFAVITMNRLIFVYFLEDQGLVPMNLLIDRYSEYNKNHMPDNFYNAYLKPLFYNVFNVSMDNRPKSVKDDPIYSQIPYLNGGLFNFLIEDEQNYSVQDEGLDLVFNNLLKGVSIGLSNEANVRPEILGFIFEKTINYVSGKGDNRQKMLGAYYTPEDVVQFITRKTLDTKILQTMIDVLKGFGWKEKDLAGIDSIEDMLSALPPNKKQITAMLNRIDSIKIIDPACGSGHFLTVVLNEFARIEASLLLGMGETPDYYDIKRKIVTNNLYGVDIDEIGIEITKLRIWLSIISEADRNDKDHVQSLPNVDFNILNGNTLVGHLKENIYQGLLPVTFDRLFYNDLKMVESMLNADGKLIVEKLISGSPSSCVEAFSILSSKYELMSGKRAIAMRGIMRRIRTGVYKVLGDAYLTYFSSLASNVPSIEELKKKLTATNPIHWSVEFHDIVCDGGFDVVLGNPPYVQDKDLPEERLDLDIIKSVRRSSGKTEMGPLFYRSQSCGNTHAYFIERSLDLLKNGGLLGFIVPVSLVSTDRMGPIREFIHNHSSVAEYYNFDDRPGKIFSGIEHCRSTIVIASKGKSRATVITSRYHRWYAENRPSLFNNLQSVSLRLQSPDGIIPKIGTETEKRILEKIKGQSRSKKLGDFVVKGGEKVWYHNAPQYWIHAHLESYVPKVEYYESYQLDQETGKITLGKFKKANISDHYKCVEFSTEQAPVVTALLNSTFFYWLFVAYSDGRDLLPQHILSIPIDLSSLSKETIEKLSRLTLELMHDYDNNSNVKMNNRKGGYAIRIKEIIPKLSYNIIKGIDVEISRIFSLSTEEFDFIENFDLEFRMGKTENTNPEE